VLLLVLRGAEVLALGVGDAEAELRRTFRQAHAHCTAPQATQPHGERGFDEAVPRSAVVFFDEALFAPL
jgi:hypothetical protein